ncbi:TRAP transporter substrate-binding protein [Tritonibacter horizontis]|uniref:C4-dicarboxylate-binding periplasmic protein n=1 Tax=Tritonibacter horizontis TaxID=1768241 RepID=A0A132C1S5_9RHOB|nr:TRAP transporter substrate-binding protein [Tritonibacter horizontis]KUP94519.1 C4-dicarboxylate-binding periplasmic protein precursor [Tritonibacter horizontis]
MSAPFRIVFGGYQGPASVHTRGAEVFAAALTRITDGDATVELRPNITAEGHKAADLLTLVEQGDIHGCYFSSSYMAGRVASLALFDMPFAAPKRDALFTRLDGDLGVYIADDVARQTGFAVLGYWDNGLRHISARRALTGPDDCKGLSLRTLASEDHQRAFRALGFDPRVIDVKDLPTAVASGEVDAQENPLTNIYNFGLHRAQPEITLTGHLQGVAPVWFHRATLESWPADLRQAIRDAITEASIAQRGFALEDDSSCTQALRADGARLHSPSDAQIRAFRDAVAAENASTRKRIEGPALELFEQPQEIAV